MTRCFVTGGTGFLGRPLGARLREAGCDVTVMSRAAANGLPGQIQGDLNDPAPWRDALRGTDLVVHLAALTGKARPDAFRKINVDGTRAVVTACREARVGRLVFVSSIAAGFPDRRDYPYASSKAAGEALVRESGIPWTIVRPTIILGRGAPVVGGLRALADRPVVLVPGRGNARVQPIAVDDCASAITAFLDGDAFLGQTVEVGGPDVVTMEELLTAIRRLLRGGNGRVVHLPLGAITSALRLLERVAFDALPVTAGQLNSFRFDGTAAAHAPRDARWRPLTHLAEMLRASLGS